MAVEQHARVQADAANRLSAAYLWSGAGLITQHMQTLRGSLEGRPTLISTVKKRPWCCKGFMLRVCVRLHLKVCVFARQGKASSRCTYKAWRALTTLFNSDISLQNFWKLILLRGCDLTRRVGRFSSAWKWAVALAVVAAVHSKNTAAELLSGRFTSIMYWWPRYKCTSSLRWFLPLTRWGACWSPFHPAAWSPKVMGRLGLPSIRS